MSTDQEKPRCERCKRKIKPRFMFRVYQGGMDVYVGPTCKRKYVLNGMYAEEDFVEVTKK